MIHNFITGGSGFVGSHLAQALLNDGQAVTILDDLSTGTTRNLDEFRSHPNLTVHIGSIMDVPLITELIDRSDRVWHLAAAVGVRLIVERPVHTIETNIRGTENILAMAARKQRPILITSTSEVYGKSTQVPFQEDADLVFGTTTRPRWAYACSKAIDEFLALAYHHENQTPVRIARLFNTVGPRQTGQYGMVIPRFIKQALANEPITIYGDGTQTRAFADVTDVVAGLRALMDTPQAAGQVFNVGNDQEITITELAQMVVEITGSTSQLQYIPFQQAYDENFEDLARRVPDLSKIKAMTGYAPRHDIRAIISRTVDWTRAQQDLP